MINFMLLTNPKIIKSLSEKDRKTKIIMKCNNPNCKNTKEISYGVYIDRLRGEKYYICTNCFQDGYRIDDFIHKSTDNKCIVEGCSNNEYESGYCLKHYFQITNINKTLKPLEHPCEICGSEINVQYHSKLNKYLCRRHRLQYDRNGTFYERTLYDSNEFIVHKDKNYADILLYNYGGDVIAKAQVDLEDLDEVKKYKWHLNDSGYAITTLDGINLRMHKVIMKQYGYTYKGHDYSKMVDHKDKNKKNNRKNNLRFATDSENKQNRDLLSTNKTGRTNLGYIKNKTKPWRIELTVNGKKVISKCFKTREEAEYILDLHILYYKPFSPEYEKLKEKYIDIYDDLMKNGIDKYIHIN